MFFNLFGSRHPVRLKKIGCNLTWLKWPFGAPLEVKKTLKGVSKTTIKNEITHDNYVSVLNTDKKELRNVCSIRSFNHQLFTFVQEKVELSSYYDKMNMINYNECVPYGYINI